MPRETPLSTYVYGLAMGFVVGFLFLYLTRGMIVDEDALGAMFWLGAFIVGTLLIGYMIYVDGKEEQ